MKQISPAYGQDYAPGYTLFTKRDDNFISRGISWFESLQEAASFRASHTLLVVDDLTGIESSSHGVEFCNLKKYFDDPGLQIVCREPEELTENAILRALATGRALEKSEAPYDYSAYLGYVISILTGISNWIKPLRKWPVPFHLPGAFVCSGFVAECYKTAAEYRDIALFREWHTSRITPNILWNRFPYKPFHFDKERA